MIQGIFGTKALSFFADMGGTSMAMLTAIRQLLAAGLVMASEIMFDGSIVPVAMIICGYVLICVVCYGFVWIVERRV